MIKLLSLDDEVVYVDPKVITAITELKEILPGESYPGAPGHPRRTRVDYGQAGIVLTRMTAQEVYDLINPVETFIRQAMESQSKIAE